MGRIVEYKIIAHVRAKDVTEEVNLYLGKGWELYGEMFAGQGFAQAVVRRAAS